jgi:hypothetical protein
VIYVIAAYTITLGSLALYAVLLQYRGRAYAAEPDASGTGVAARLPRGFNIGAALLSPFWMWSHGLRLPGAILFALWVAMIPLYEREMWVPFLLVAGIPLAAGAALGFVANRIAAGHRGAESVAEFSASQLRWAIAGIGLYVIVLPWTWYFLNAGA